MNIIKACITLIIYVFTCGRVNMDNVLDADKAPRILWNEHGATARTSRPLSLWRDINRNKLDLDNTSFDQSALFASKNSDLPNEEEFVTDVVNNLFQSQGSHSDQKQVIKDFDEIFDKANEDLLLHHYYFVRFKKECQNYNQAIEELSKGYSSRKDVSQGVLKVEIQRNYAVSFYRLLDERHTLDFLKRRPNKASKLIYSLILKHFEIYAKTLGGDFCTFDQTLEDAFKRAPISDVRALCSNEIQFYLSQLSERKKHERNEKIRDAVSIPAPPQDSKKLDDASQKIAQAQELAAKEKEQYRLAKLEEQRKEKHPCALRHSNKNKRSEVLPETVQGKESNGLNALHKAAKDLDLLLKAACDEQIKREHELQREREEAARKAEQQRKQEEAARIAQQQREQEEAARKAEEQRKQQERERQAAEAKDKAKQVRIKWLKDKQDSGKKIYEWHNLQFNNMHKKTLKLFKSRKLQLEKDHALKFSELCSIKIQERRGLIDKQNELQAERSRVYRGKYNSSDWQKLMKDKDFENRRWYYLQGLKADEHYREVTQAHKTCEQLRASWMSGLQKILEHQSGQWEKMTKEREEENNKWYEDHCKDADTDDVYHAHHGYRESYKKWYSELLDSCLKQIGGFQEEYSKACESIYTKSFREFEQRNQDYYKEQAEHTINDKQWYETQRVQYQQKFKEAQPKQTEQEQQNQKAREELLQNLKNPEAFFKAYAHILNGGSENLVSINEDQIEQQMDILLHDLSDEAILNLTNNNFAKALRDRVRIWHPDLFAYSDKTSWKPFHKFVAQAIFKRIQQAHDRLKAAQ